MTEIKHKPLVVEMYATTEQEFKTKREELLNQGFKPCNDYTKAVGVFKQTFVETSSANLKYITDYLFEANVDGKFDTDIVNKMYDRW